MSTDVVEALHAVAFDEPSSRLQRFGGLDVLRGDDVVVDDDDAIGIQTRAGHRQIPG